MDREHFYQFPELTPKKNSYETADRKKDKDKYFDNNSFDLKPREEPQLRRYIDKRIPKDCSASQVLAIAQILVSEVRQLPHNKSEISNRAEQDLSNCITALLAAILFFSDEAKGQKIYINIFNLYNRYYQGESLLDVYNISIESIINPSKFLNKFNSRINWYSSLSTYTHNKYRDRSIDRLRSLPGSRGFKRTNLGFLRKDSCEATIKVALNLAGEKGDRLSGLLLLYNCFMEVVKNGNFPTNKPQPNHYQILLDRYQERVQYAGVNSEIADLEQIIKYLDHLGNVFRNYRQLKEVEWDGPLSEDKRTTLGDLQADSQEIVNSENRENYSEITEPTLKLLYKHSGKHKLLLCLHGLKLNQEEAMVEVDLIEQYKVSREQDRLLAIIAKELHAIYPHKPSGQKLSHDLVAEYRDYLKTICKDYYPELLRVIYLEIKESALSDSNIERLFINRLETQWQFKFKPEGVGLSKVVEFVQQRTNQP